GPEPPAVDDEDRAERRHMQRHLDEHAGRAHAGNVPDHGQMSVARDRQEFGEPLHQSEQNPLPEVHATFPATSATIPATIAVLRRVLTRSMRPRSSHTAAIMTAICARRAM